MPKSCDSPKKSIRRMSLETQILTATVWRVMRLRMRPYKLQILQALKADDKQLQQQMVDGQFDKKNWP